MHFPIGELIPVIAILTIFIGAPSMVFYWILRLKRESRSGGNGALGMQELEDRIQRAVERANEPLRLQLSSLEDRLEAMDQKHTALPSTSEPAALLSAREPQPH